MAMMPKGKLGSRIGRKWQIVLAFLLGAAASSLAQDPSDYVFFWMQSHGYTGVFWSTINWYFVPFLLYLGLFFIGYILAKTRLVSAVFMVFFLIILFVLSAIYSFTLPQSSSTIYIAAVIIGTFVSVGILLGLRGQVK